MAMNIVLCFYGYVGIEDALKPCCQHSERPVQC